MLLYRSVSVFFSSLSSLLNLSLSLCVSLSRCLSHSRPLVCSKHFAAIVNTESKWFAKISPAGVSWPLLIYWDDPNPK